MHSLVTLITREYNPADCNFIRVPASDLLDKIQQTPDQLDEDWDRIFEELRANNIFMQPALADVLPDEFVRIFRADSPLGQIILEALDPTADGDKLMAQAILKLNGKAQSAGGPGRKAQARQGRRARSRSFQKLQPKRQKASRPLLDHGSTEPPDPTRLNKGSHYIRPLE